MKTEVNNISGYIKLSEISENVKYKFDFSGMFFFIRIVNKEEGFYDRFKRICIGEKEYKYNGNFQCTPSKCYDYFIQPHFNEGDDFIVEHNNCIDYIMIFFKDFKEKTN